MDGFGIRIFDGYAAYIGMCPKHRQGLVLTGAGEGIRTLDVLLGKQALYR